MFVRMNQEFLTWEKCEHCVNLKYWALDGISVARTFLVA